MSGKKTKQILTIDRFSLAPALQLQHTTIAKPFVAGCSVILQTSEWLRGPQHLLPRPGLPIQRRQQHSPGTNAIKLFCHLYLIHNLLQN